MNIDKRLRLCFLESVGHVVGGTVGAVATVTGATVNAAGQIVGATVKTTGHLVSGTVNTTGKVLGGAVNAVGNVAGGSRSRRKKVSIPPEVTYLVQKVLSGESISPFAAWDDFVDWFDNSGECKEYTSTLINQQMEIMTDEKTVNEGINFLALCLNTTKIHSKVNAVLKVTVESYERKLASMTSIEREIELIAIMLYFCKICELFGIQ